MATPRPLAPGRLELVQEFVNSAEISEGEDELRSTKDAVAWLRQHGTRIGRLTDAERQMISSWNAAHIGRGLWHIGQGRAYVIQGVLSRTERELFFTNERMTV